MKYDYEILFLQTWLPKIHNRYYKCKTMDYLEKFVKSSILTQNTSVFHLVFIGLCTFWLDESE